MGDEFDSQSTTKNFIEYIKTVDSDRHLAQTYRQALAHSKPDIIVFLGDLYNDGSIATDLQFISFLRRFQTIFPFPKNVPAIMIPGDNDIGKCEFHFYLSYQRNSIKIPSQGGEANEVVKPSKIYRFQKTFKGKETWKFEKKLNIYHINRITHELPQGQ